jgi:hypothetical protein
MIMSQAHLRLNNKLTSSTNNFSSINHQPHYLKDNLHDAATDNLTVTIMFSLYGEDNDRLFGYLSHLIC